MSRCLKAWPAFLSAALAILFQACEPSSSEPPRPASALYECRGEPGYAGTWEEVIGPLRASGALDSQDRLPCGDTAAPVPDVTLMIRGNAEAGAAEKARLRVVVLDAQCGLKNEYTDTVTFGAGRGPAAGFFHWNTRFADGTRAPSGEYFINTVAEWENGSRDTSWSKIGMLATACGD
jgi:hypothetical protein